jgi:biopolymer transport protein TolR
MPARAMPFQRGRGRRTINEINMVPFIDVMLVLLIIFMVTAPLITPSLIDLPRPRAATTSARWSSAPTSR